MLHAVLRGHLPAETSAVKRPFGGAASAQDEDFVPKKPKEAAPKPVLGAAGLASPVGAPATTAAGIGDSNHRLLQLVHFTYDRKSVSSMPRTRRARVAPRRPATTPVRRKRSGDSHRTCVPQAYKTPNTAPSFPQNLFSSFRKAECEIHRRLGHGLHLLLRLGLLGRVHLLPFIEECLPRYQELGLHECLAEPEMDAIRMLHHVRVGGRTVAHHILLEAIEGTHMHVR